MGQWEYVERMQTGKQDRPKAAFTIESCVTLGTPLHALSSPGALILGHNPIQELITVPWTLTSLTHHISNALETLSICFLSPMLPNMGRMLLP